MSRYSWILSVCLLPWWVGCGPSELVTVGPDDKRIVYSGRVHLTGESALFSYPGVSIKARFTGSTLNILLRDGGQGGEASTNYYYVILDEGRPVKLEARPGQTVYEIADGLWPGEHTVELVKLTESQVGSTEFLGLQVRGELLEAPRRPGMRIEAIGDSFTCAYGNEAVHQAPPLGNPTSGFHSINQNFYDSYAAVAARELEAEVVGVCYSGRGLYLNNSGTTEGTLPRLYERILPHDEELLWDVRRDVPDVVVINLGVNDFANFTDSTPPPEPFQGAYKEFVRRLRGYYPRAKILCVVGPMLSDSYPPGHQHWSTIQGYVSQVVADLNAAGDPEVYYLALSPQGVPYGEDWHPSIASHDKAGYELAQRIMAIHGW